MPKLKENQVPSYRLHKQSAQAIVTLNGRDFLLGKQSHYRKPDGTPTSELAVYKQVLKVLRRLYGHTKAKDFGPLRLKATMSEMISLGWCRTSINAHAGRIKRMFAWAVENELLPDFTTDKDGRGFSSRSWCHGRRTGTGRSSSVVGGNEPANVANAATTSAPRPTAVRSAGPSRPLLNATR